MRTPDELPTTDVAIAGGGYVGLALALALAHEVGPDLAITVIDRAPPTPSVPERAADDPRASALSAASRHMLEALGVWREIAAAAVPVERIEITDSPLGATTRPSLLDYENVTDSGAPASFIVPNADLGAALERAVAAVPSVARCHRVGVARLEMSPGCNRLVLDDGRVLPARLAVAADGRRSVLREAAGIRTVDWDYGQTGIVTTIGHERDHLGHAVQHFLPGGPFAMLPLAGGHLSCITWSEAAGEARRVLALDDAGFLAEIEVRVAGRLGRLELAGSRKSWPLSAHLARSYVAPRLALVGDAAHGVHPIGGQGLNLGFRDVAALAECLADGVRVGMDIGGSEALVRYERWRRFDSAMSSAAYTGLNRLFSNDWTIVRTVRDAGLGVLDRLPGVKRVLVGEAAGLSGELPRLLRPPARERQSS